ncbi:hypothetical protein [Vibrio tasmaniensis]|uniref:hypothetical protein n=3 Tax=Vibrionaceae TaxID=641 RepID=UPI001F0F8A46|nr:hypothetical protein [Vibrio tasmaniensis]
MYILIHISMVGVMLHCILFVGFIMKDSEHVNFSEDYELNRHLELVEKSQSINNREYLREHTGPRAKKELGKTVLTHAEFKPYVKQDKPYLADPV